MSNKQNIQETLVSMGFNKNYIGRAFKVYEISYGHMYIYNIEVITEIIVRLQNKDRAKKQRNADNKCNKTEIDEPNKTPANKPLLQQSQSSKFKAEINKIRQNGLIEITYPANIYLMKRNKATVNSQQIFMKRNKNRNSNNPNNNDANTQPFTPHMTLEEAKKLRIHDKIDHRDQVGRFVCAIVSEKQGTNLKIHYYGWSQKWDTWSDFSLQLYRFANVDSISKRPARIFKHLKKDDYVDVNPTYRHPGWKCGQIRRLDQKSGQVQVVYESLDKNYMYWTHLDNISEIAQFTSKTYQEEKDNAEENKDNIEEKDIEFIEKDKDNMNENSNNSKPNRKRKFDCMNEIELEPSLKRIKLMNINNDFVDYKKENEKLKQRLDLLECKSEKIKAMNLNELNELKVRMQNKIKLIEESEKELIDNTYKCVACMDHAKNVSFTDGCSHVALCDKCEQSMQTKSCPICQMPYTNVKKINF